MNLDQVIKLRLNYFITSKNINLWAIKNPTLEIPDYFKLIWLEYYFAQVNKHHYSSEAILNDYQYQSIKQIYDIFVILYGYTFTYKQILNRINNDFVCPIR